MLAQLRSAQITSAGQKSGQKFWAQSRASAANFRAPTPYAHASRTRLAYAHGFAASHVPVDSQA
jgi:hypothetical protein